MPDSLGSLLIVDDETELVSALCETLAAQGYETDGFTSGKAALRALADKDFDVLLTDLMMPEMDGLALLQAALEIDPHLIGIMMTGHGTVQTAVDAMKVGAFDYVLKPFKLNALLPVLSRAMHLRRLHHENIQLRQTIAIYELTRTIASTATPDAILNKVAEAAFHQANADETVIWLPAPDADELVVAAVCGDDARRLLGKRKPTDDGDEGWVIQNQAPRLRDTAVWLPMLAGGKLEGVLQINAARRRRPLTPGDIKALTILVNIAGPALENARLFATLIESKLFIDTVIDSLPGLFYITDSQMRIVRWNRYKEELLGLPPERIRGSYLPLSIHEADRERTIQQFEKVLEDGYGEIEARVLAGHGSRWFFITGVRLEIGGAAFIVGTGIDITERKQTEEKFRELNAELEKRVFERTKQLEAANKELEAFSYSVSHDLRAPLRAIDGFSRILLEEYAQQLDAEAGRLLQKTRDNAQLMGQLIEDLLAFSRLSRQPLTKQTVEPADLVRQVLDELEAERAGRNIEMIIGELPPCQADPALLKRVFVNLLANALKFTSRKDSAAIEIGCRQMNGESVYFIKDNGAGFDMHYADKLFGVFQRLHSSQEYEGTGVGLAIVQRIINRHGGNIWADAEAGKGATFYFTLGGNPD